MIRYIAFLLIPLLSACQSSAPPSDTARTAFSTTAPSLLYFKNMRSAYYQSKEQSNTRIIDYVSNRCSKLNDFERSITPMIASDWLNDQAFLIMNTSNENAAPALSEASTGEARDMPGPRPQTQTEWWITVYRDLIDGMEFQVTQDGEVTTLSADWAACIQITTKDYLSLTEQQ